MVIPLPAGAQDVELGQGFHACCTTIADGRIAHAMPLTPGVTQFRFGYSIPHQQGTVALELSAAAPVQQLAAFVPVGAGAISVQGLVAGETIQSNQRTVRTYSAANLEAGAKVTLTITSQAADQDAGRGANATPAPASPVAPKMIAGLGLAALAIGAGVVLFLPKKKKQA